LFFASITRLKCFNLRVLVSDWNLFYKNHVDLMIIKANGSLILVLCMIENKTMLFIVRDLVWSKSCVCWFLINTLFVLCFSCVWSVLFERFLSFYVFDEVNLFWFWVFVLVCFRVNPNGSKLSQSLGFVWFDLEGLFGLRVCLANTLYVCFE